MRRIYVWRDDKLVEVTLGNIAKQVNVPSTGEYRDKMHSYYGLDEVRDQHMIDSNRAEYAHNKALGR